MNRLLKIFVAIVLIFSSTICFTSCKKETAVPTPPVVTTTKVSDITQTTALIGGTVTDDGGARITEIGFCWGTSPNPTTSSNKTPNVIGSDTFTSSITGLTANTKYYVRAYATNSAGTSYGTEFTFTTNDITKASNINFNPNLTYGAISDIDFNAYKTIQIGYQIWMAENLRTTRLNDGTPIPNVNDSKEWGTLTSSGYSWYNNNSSSYKDTYGAIYNWFTVNTDKLCPVGWHVPSGAEWNTLITYLGGWNIASSKLMETGTAHWLNPNTGATNLTGFTGLPGGSRYGDDNFLGYIDYPFFELGYEGSWWSATETGGTDYALIADIHSREDYNFTGAGQLFKNDGASVRCVKDN